MPDFCVVIKTDGKDTWVDKKPIDWKKLGYQKTVELLISSGIVGLGGATFPSHLKLTKKDHGAKLTTLIINAAECEPYITCDDMLMRERVDELIRGINLLHDFLEFEESIISIEDNKNEAIDKKLLRYLTVRVKEFDLDTNYFGKKEESENKESTKN